MIAFLAPPDRTRHAREDLWQDFRLIVRETAGRLEVYCDGRDEPGCDKPVGVLATREDHLRGLELAGFVILWPVAPEVLTLAVSRVWKSCAGSAVTL